MRSLCLIPLFIVFLAGAIDQGLASGSATTVQTSACSSHMEMEADKAIAGLDD
jgi:hypothetical protein